MCVCDPKNEKFSTDNEIPCNSHEFYLEIHSNLQVCGHRMAENLDKNTLKLIEKSETKLETEGGNSRRERQKE